MSGEESRKPGFGMLNLFQPSLCVVFSLSRTCRKANGEFDRAVTGFGTSARAGDAMSTLLYSKLVVSGATNLLGETSGISSLLRSQQTCLATVLEFLIF